MNVIYGRVPFVENLRNLQIPPPNKSMAVNGASVNKVFSWVPDEGKEISVSKLTILLKDDGASTFAKFGSISVLTGGILIEAVIDGVAREICNIRDNGDLCTHFPFSQFGSAAVLSILSVVTPQGFGDSNDVFVGSMQFSEPLGIIAANGDLIRATVRDDLSAIDTLLIGIHGTRRN